jgi:hypothetical protein
MRSLLCEFYVRLASPAQTYPALRIEEGKEKKDCCVSRTPSSAAAARLASAPTANADIRGSLARAARRHGAGGRVRASIIQQRLSTQHTVTHSPTMGPWHQAAHAPTYGLSNIQEHPAPGNQPRHVRAARTPGTPRRSAPDRHRRVEAAGRAQLSRSRAGQKARCWCCWCGAGLNNGFAAPNPTGRSPNGHNKGDCSVANARRRGRKGKGKGEAGHVDPNHCSWVASFRPPASACGKMPVFYFRKRKLRSISVHSSRRPGPRIDQHLAVPACPLLICRLPGPTNHNLLLLNVLLALVMVLQK